MPSRKHYFPTLSLPWWNFTPFFDWGDTTLEDIGAAGFSLLPKRMNAPMLEHARSFPTVRPSAATIGKALTNEAMVIIPSRSKATAQAFQRTSAPPWENVVLQTAAVLHGTHSHQNRQSGLELRIVYRLHQQDPLVVWQMEIINHTPRPLNLKSFTLLRVGPPHKVHKHRRSDFIPTRFRLFNLRRSPKTQSAYYNVTERFGSLRLHALDAPAFQIHQPDMGKIPPALALPEDFMPPHFAAVLNIGQKSGLAVLVGQLPFDARLHFAVNSDPLAPGITLRVNPATPVAIPANGALLLPAGALAWLPGDTPAQRTLLQI